MAMQRLTPTEKSAFVLRHIEDRSTSEIAELLGIAPNATISCGAEAAARNGTVSEEYMNHLSEEQVVDL